MKLFAVVLALLWIWLVPLQVCAKGKEDDKARVAALSGKYEKLENQQKLIEKQIGSAKNEKEKQLLQIQQLDEQIETAQAQMDVLDERIYLLEGYVTQKQQELEEKQAELDLQYELFRQRLGAMTRLPQVSALGVALGSDSYYSFIVNRVSLERMTEYDRQILDGLAEEKQLLETIQMDMRTNRDTVAKDKERLNEKRQDFGRKMAQVQKQIQDIALMEEQYLANKDALRRQMNQVQAEIDLVYEEIERKSQIAEYQGGAVANGSMIHPAPGLNQITSQYGWRFGQSDFHTGIDFSVAGAYGKTIVAAAAGKVAFVNTAYTPGYGYGKYVIIDHGGGITTLYAHCSSIDVKLGQTVSQGQAIAKVGSTGWSTGPHCHFEVRVGKKHTNPMPYLSLG